MKSCEKEALLNLDALKALFRYDNGAIYFNYSNNNSIKVNARAGCFNKTLGYRCVGINRFLYTEHRIIWMLHYGYIPEGFQIDHKNLIKDDNRIENLRLATPLQNSGNVTMKTNNKSGVRGVSLSRGRWKASITINRKYIHLGRFNTLEEAKKAYYDASVKYRGEFANVSYFI